MVSGVRDSDVGMAGPCAVLWRILKPNVEPPFAVETRHFSLVALLLQVGCLLGFLFPLYILRASINIRSPTIFKWAIMLVAGSTLVSMQSEMQ